MEFQAFVNTVDMPCCVLSVEKAGEGSWGEIRIANMQIISTPSIRRQNNVHSHAER